MKVKIVETLPNQLEAKTLYAIKPSGNNDSVLYLSDEESNAKIVSIPSRINSYLLDVSKEYKKLPTYVGEGANEIFFEYTKNNINDSHKLFVKNLYNNLTAHIIVQYDGYALFTDYDTNFIYKHKGITEFVAANEEARNNRIGFGLNQSAYNLFNFTFIHGINRKEINLYKPVEFSKYELDFEENEIFRMNVEDIKNADSDKRQKITELRNKLNQFDIIQNSNYYAIKLNGGIKMYIARNLNVENEYSDFAHEIIVELYP